MLVSPSVCSIGETLPLPLLDVKSRAVSETKHYLFPVKILLTTTPCHGLPVRVGMPSSFIRAAIRSTELRRAANKASLCRAGSNRRGGAASRAAGLFRLATLSEAGADRRIPRLNANAGSRSDPRRKPRRDSSRYPRSTPIRTASAEHLHAFRSALLPAAGPAGQQRAATGRDRCRCASRQSRSHRLAALSEAIAVRGFLEQAISPASRRHPRSKT